MAKKENKLVLYKDEDGKLSVNTLFADEDVWLTQDQLAEIYQTTQENISMHISNIYADDELDKEGTYKKFLLVRQEGKRQVNRHIDHYNLDVIIALGYRVQSPIAVRSLSVTNSHKQPAYRLDGTASQENDCGIVIQNGKKYFKLQNVR